jgi:hypothetical protein
MGQAQQFLNLQLAGSTGSRDQKPRTSNQSSSQGMGSNRELLLLRSPVAAERLTRSERAALNIFSHLTVKEQALIIATLRNDFDTRNPLIVEQVAAWADVARHREFLKYLSQHKLAAISQLAEVLTEYLPGTLLLLKTQLEGYTVGTLTARGNRDGQALLLQEIESFSGTPFDPTYLYFLNDRARNARLLDFPSTARRKLQICIDFLKGEKRSANGSITPMPRKFDEVVFIDDEHKNCHTVSNWILECALQEHRQRAPFTLANDLDEYAAKVRELFKFRNDDRATRQLHSYLQRTHRERDPDHIAHRLRVIPAERMNAERLARSLAKILLGECRPAYNACNRLYLFDIDGTVVQLPAKMYIRQRCDDAEIIKITQEQYAENPSMLHWYQKAQTKYQFHGRNVPMHELYYDFREFEEEASIRRTIEIARINNALFKPKQSTQRTKDKAAMHFAAPSLSKAIQAASFAQSLFRRTTSSANPL